MSRLSKNEFERRLARRQQEVLFSHPSLQQRERERVLLVRRMILAFALTVAGMCALVVLLSCT